MGKTIVINLNTNSISEMPTPAEHYGRGLAMKLVRQYAEDGCSRLDEGNALAIVCGLLTGTNAPCANRASVAAMGNNAVAVSSISGDFPQKLASRICAIMETAISSGVSPPISRPIGV
mgnify:CR=1 FL=1